MIPKKIRIEILKRIRKAEKEHNVRVIYAIESGSRAWGFASPNSDFDVRFIYVRPKDWYLAVDIEARRDVIEYDIVDEIDINGWDIRKALQLFWKSNPTFIEWLQSPIIYLDDNEFANSARKLIKEIYSIDKGIYHYRSMAEKNYRKYLTKDIVSIKKYFYVLRPLLSIMWLEQKREVAPIEFHVLREMISDNNTLNEEVSKLLARKIKSMEKEVAPMIPVLNTFIEAELKRLAEVELPSVDRQGNMGQLNNLLVKILNHI